MDMPIGKHSEEKKDEGRGSRGREPARAVLPGAGAVGKMVAPRFDERIEVKRAVTGIPVIEVNGSNLNRDVLAKQQARRERSSAAYGKQRIAYGRTDNACSKPGTLGSREKMGTPYPTGDRLSTRISAHTDLRSAMSTLEDRITAKVRHDSGRSNGKQLDKKPATMSPRSGAVAVNPGGGLKQQYSPASPEKQGVGSFSVKSNGVNGPFEKSPEKAPDRPGRREMGPLPSLDGVLDEDDIEYGIKEPSHNAEGLAVATAVMDTDEDAFIPSAVQYDPDAKPPLYKRSRLLLYSTVCFIFVVLAAISAGVGVSQTQDNTLEAIPVPFRETLGIREQIERIIGSDRLEDENSPYSQALEWITHEDPQELTPEDSNFLQRFIMAYLYFATSEDHPWSECNPLGTPGDDYLAPGGNTSLCVHGEIVSLTPTITREFREGKIRWLSEITECKWLGAFCDDFGQVRGIELQGLNLTGTFPDGIKYLSFLQTFSVGYNKLRGNIPGALGTLKHLANVELQNNALTGSIPDGFWSSRSLQRINLAKNMLSGSISSAVANLKGVKGLYLYDNLVTGQIPDEMGDLTTMAFIRLQRTKISGTIPSTLGKLRGLGGLWLNGNDLSGTIPPELGNPPGLVDLRLKDNKALSGTIPDEVYTPNMYRLELNNCNLTGTISERIANMTSLAVFRVDGNQLSGKIPGNLTQLVSLSTFHVQDNDINGTIPQELCKLRNESEAFQSVQADCLAPPDGGMPEVLCPSGCCTLCCDASGGVCVDALEDF